MKWFRTFSPLLVLALLVVNACEIDKVILADSDDETPFVNHVLIEKVEITENFILKDTITPLLFHQDFLNNIGIGYDSHKNNRRLSLFGVNTSAELLKFSLDEEAQIHYFLSFNEASSDSMAAEMIDKDEVRFVKNRSKLKAKYNSRSYHLTENTIHLNVIFQQRMGYMNLEFDGNKINEHIMYKSSLADDVDKDSLIFSVQYFNTVMGDCFVSKMEVGTLFESKIEIYNVQANQEKEKKVLKEALACVKEFQNGNKSWEEITSTTTYLSKSDFFSSGYYAIPRVVNFSPLHKEIDYLKTIYKKADVGILAWYYTPYSILFPTIDFTVTE